jgi:hypothetical protein
MSSTKVPNLPTLTQVGQSRNSTTHGVKKRDKVEKMEPKKDDYNHNELVSRNLRTDVEKGAKILGGKWPWSKRTPVIGCLKASGLSNSPHPLVSETKKKTSKKCNILFA